MLALNNGCVTILDGDLQCIYSIAFVPFVRVSMG